MFQSLYLPPDPVPSLLVHPLRLEDGQWVCCSLLGSYLFPEFIGLAEKPVPVSLTGGCVGQSITHPAGEVFAGTVDDCTPAATMRTAPPWPFSAIITRGPVKGDLLLY